MQRREFIKLASTQATFAVGLPLAFGRAAAAQDAAANTEPPSRFDFASLTALAKERAAADYNAPASTLSGSFADLNYDQYRAIRFRRDSDPWRNQTDFGLDLLSPGLIFHEPVQINLVKDGAVTPVPFSTDLLEFDPSGFPDGPTSTDVGDMGWSGFRLRTKLNRPDVLDEFIVFQGASYFRAVARDTLYGLSARGLALGTGSAEGEEFPLFTDFWIHQPGPAAQSVRIHAILDSRSVSGSFQFDVSPGSETVIVTRMSLFPRAELKRVGVAPLTSMYWFGPASRTRIDDYRPAVHDSDGLQMVTGTGRRLWRVLAAPQKLQISGFMDENPRGFGLAQRERDFEAYQDAEARYEMRPSAWIEPLSNWGKGTVTLVEIPVENEFNDNIVSFWSPAEPMQAGQRYDYEYRMTFSPHTVDDAPLARVIQTRSGQPVNDPEGLTVIVDFELEIFGDTIPEPKLSASTGKITNPYLVRLPEEGAMRLAFLFTPDGERLSELSAELHGEKGPLSETWLARWAS